MSFTQRGFYLFRNSKDLFLNKTFQNYAVLTLAFFVGLGFFFNAYTVESYEPIPTYEECLELSNTSTQTEGMSSHLKQCNQTADFFLSGLDIVNPGGNENAQYIFENPNLSDGAKLGLLGTVDQPLTALVYNPPRIDVAEHLAQQWIPNYAPQTNVYASGYDRLTESGIADIWSSVRNVAYIFFVIVFIVGGFMIMFRHKLGGQTMVTLYNTLPNIIVGLVLVTFSFAIVGFLIDIGALLIRVMDGFLDVSQKVDAASPWGVADTYSEKVMDSVMTNLIQNLQDTAFSGLGKIASKIFGAIFEFILAVIFLFISIKILFALIKAYIGIVFDTITSPIVLAIATIPGKSGVMKDWFNRVMKNVMVFVFIFVLLHLPMYFYDKGVELNIFVTDFSSGVSQNSVVASLVLGGVTLYMLFLAPGVGKMLDEYFPQTGGKGGQGAADGAKKEASKIPLVGGFFKG
jgi:hypothetical protein